MRGISLLVSLEWSVLLAHEYLPIEKRTDRKKVRCIYSETYYEPVAVLVCIYMYVCRLEDVREKRVVSEI